MKDEWRLIFYRENDDAKLEERPLGYSPVPRFNDNIIFQDNTWEVMFVCMDYDSLIVNVYIQED